MLPTCVLGFAQAFAARTASERSGDVRTTSETDTDPRAAGL